ncbi:MAG: helix-turn-helix transcriptional regulator [Alphaproteobacteria bacterium]|nr:helix-turn-helix transcriptional regulator [Alphaproteobacteria bacterium]NCQ67139.1 helix-turn-helix transcriptional regulator [Alphaproteobacteria bacterium]NCT07735.1 helix-turn-helix transcriptional regulator [Alphaproteobacteria bacterium]
MSDILLKNIQSHINYKSLSVSAVERMAGLKKNAVYNILKGISKKPSLETIQAISVALDCSINDLIEDKGVDISHASAILEDPSFFIESAKMITIILKESGKKVSLDIFCSMAQELYLFSFKKKLQTPDRDFAEWIVDKKD